MSDSTPEANDGMQPAPSGAAPLAPTGVPGQHQAFDDAAAQLVAAWDLDIDSRTPAEGIEALERLKAPAPAPVAADATSASGSAALDDEHALVDAPRKTARGMWVGVAVLAACLAGWAALRNDVSAPTGAVAPEPYAANDPPTANTAPAVAAQEPAPGSEEAETAERFALTVRTIPPDATLHIDGREVTNPYVGEHEAASDLKVTARAEDHEPAERELELTEDMNLMVTLTPLDDAPRVRKHARRRTSNSRAKKRESKRQRRHRSSKKTAGFVSNNPYQ